MIQADLIIEGAAELLTLTGAGNRPRRGEEMGDLGIIQRGALAARRGKIVWVGPTADLLTSVRPMAFCKLIDAYGKTVMPGLVDPHTHLVFAGSRENEFAMRIQGKTYLEIAAAGGGINATVVATRQASKAELTFAARRSLNRMLPLGTTTVETKSGYGLDLETEIKMLEVIQGLNQDDPITVVPTFMGAHEIPPEFRQDPEAYVDLVITRMIPAVAERKLARFCDVFCETGVFSVAQTERIFRAAQAAGMETRVHADELTDLGGAAMAARMKARTADHLLYANDDGIRAMAQAGVIAVLLPGTAYFLHMQRYARARDMIAAGVPVALATDFNPGSCMTESMPLIMNMACTQMRMLPAEAITAATINAAWAIGEQERVGSLEVGKQADLLVLDAPNHEHLCYHFGVNLVERVVKDGKVVAENGRRIR
ncbi:MAG: imidazolonepropionase [candidate division NC10 bacterium]|nr:imidazolonepropionase [candidate division NC10 bacterium]